VLLGRPAALRAFADVEAELDLLARAGHAEEAVREVQQRKLERLWRRAASTQYYAELTGSGPARLEGIPVTPKVLVRSRWKEFLVPEAATPYRYYETSGTTSGGPLAVPRLVEDVVWNTVTLADAWSKLVQPREPAAVLLPSDVAPVGDTVTAACEYLGAPVVRCYPYALGICDFDRAQEIFRRFRPRTVFAAPGLLMEFMRALKRRGSFADAAASISRVMLLGEVATPSLQRLIARAWDAETFDASYGSTETGTVAATCPENRLHLLASAFVAEIGDEEIAPARAGAAGGLVVTPLNGFARPLLRYETGDTVTFSCSCPCGLAAPTLSVAGRIGETVAVGDVLLDVSAVEEVVYGLDGVTGYLLEIGDGEAGLVLERDIDCGSSEEELGSTAAEAFAERGVEFTRIRVVHQLSASTKSGAAQKNWKKTNVRVMA
jgi:phenylacetate-CoA ligase